ENNSIEFIPFLETLYISKQKNETLIKSSTQDISTTFPFLWIWAQCQNHSNFFKISPSLILNSLYIKYITPTKDQHYTCHLRNNETLVLAPKEFRELKLTF
ncbi:MAG: LytTR family transcriptional regulator DNA-binding domain-containing protein, partial [Candidatus Arcticimaribacter sp.]